MVICHCRAVNDQAIRTAIVAGAREPAELARMCGAGGRCGGCLPALEALIEEIVPRRREPARSSASAA